MTLTIQNVLQWDPSGVSNAGSTYLEMGAHVNQLVSQFTNDSDLSSAWQGKAGAAAQKTSLMVAQSIQKISRSFQDAGQLMISTAKQMEAIKSQLQTASSTVSSLGAGFALNPDGTLTLPPAPPPGSGQPSVKDSVPDVQPIVYQHNVDTAKAALAQAQSALQEAQALDATLAASLTTSFLMRPANTQGWIAIESARLNGVTDPKIAAAFSTLSNALSMQSGQDAALQQAYAEIEKMSPLELTEFFQQLPPNVAQQWKNYVASAYKFGTTNGNQPPPQFLSMLNYVTKTADLTTLGEIQDSLGFLEPSAALNDPGSTAVYNEYQRYGSLLFGPNGQLNPASSANQGATGDCYFIAALVGIARQDPNFIKNHIQQNANGTYTVTLYKSVGGAQEPVQVTVTPDFPDYSWSPSTNAYSSAAGESWAAVYEKAFAQMRGGYTAIDANVSNLDPAGALSVIGGPSVSPSYKSTSAFGFSTVSLSDLQNRVSHGQVITAGTNPTTTSSKIIGDHAYTIVAVNSQTNTVTLQNPWGPGGAGQAPEFLTLSKSDFLANFYGIYGSQYLGWAP